MSDVIEFTSKPSHDELDDKDCRYRGCDTAVYAVVRFRNPKEYVPYCRDHSHWAHGEFNDAKRTLTF